jgi:Lipase (class 3)
VASGSAHSPRLPSALKLQHCLSGGSSASVAASPGVQWRLVITGHSLGAGIAAFAGLFLHSLYPETRVWCYSPPGWLMTPELAAYSKHFVTSVVINKDVITRCGALHLCTCWYACAALHLAGQGPATPLLGRGTRERPACMACASRAR